MIHQQINTHYQDVDTLSLQVKELQQELRRTQENLTTTINRVKEYSFVMIVAFGFSQ